MDFSDFSEFIGPLIFGIIAWLSNYFSKKKKPKESVSEKPKNQAGEKSAFEKMIFDNFKSARVEDNPLEEIEIIESSEDKVNEDIKIIKEEELLTNQKVNPKNKTIPLAKTKESPLSKLKTKLKNKDSLKEAVILKEILDRKY